ncbi:MAG: ECF-type sigma factor [Acidobacteriota bacterium]
MQPLPVANPQQPEEVYRELRRLAGHYFRFEKAGHTLQPTALVHEAWIRLSESDRWSALDRDHFLSLAARTMRRVLCDHARARGRAKRGAGAARITLADDLLWAAPDSVDLLDLDVALGRLETHDADKARIVEMRFFGGLTTAEIARCLGKCSRTVEREWARARAWLLVELEHGRRD